MRTKCGKGIPTSPVCYDAGYNLTNSLHRYTFTRIKNQFASIYKATHGYFIEITRLHDEVEYNTVTCGDLTQLLLKVRK